MKRNDAALPIHISNHDLGPVGHRSQLSDEDGQYYDEQTKDMLNEDDLFKHDNTVQDEHDALSNGSMRSIMQQWKQF